MNPTPTAIRALKIIRDHGPIRPREFGEKLWGKEHPGWRRVSKAGPSGSTRGGGMNLAAGGYIGKLFKAGWVWPNYFIFGPRDQEYRFQGWELTDAGHKILQEYDQAP